MKKKSFVFFIQFFCCSINFPSTNSSLQLTAHQVYEIGQKIWRNECGGKVEGLTTWKEGEEFPSMGIGHFIWFPKNCTVQFKESFPALITFIESKGHRVPSWLKGQAPWQNRTAFLDAISSRRMNQLRNFLKNSIPLQTEFMIRRLLAAVPSLLKHAPSGRKQHVKQQLQRILAQPTGAYVLIDYINFKGEGINVGEQYNNNGWGILQVLNTMQPHGDALEEFVKAARIVLEQRVAHSPPHRNEKQWLPGWFNRLDTYLIS